MKDFVFHHAFRIEYNGLANQLITDCHIAHPSVVNGSRNKEFRPFKALWDTGATNSIITKNVIDSLSLPPIGVAVTSGVHGPQEVNTYMVDIGLPNTVLVTDVQVTDGNLCSNIDVLIGMDVILLGDFAIANAAGKTIFSFCIPPHRNPIDLLEKSNAVNPKNKSNLP